MYDVRLFLIKKGGGQACGLAFRTPVSHIRVLGLSLAFAPDSGLLLMCPFGVSEWWLKWFGPCHTYRRRVLRFWLLAFSWPSPKYCKHLVNDPTKRAFCGCLLICLSLSTSQTNTIFLKTELQVEVGYILQNAMILYMLSIKIFVELAAHNYHEYY